MPRTLAQNAQYIAETIKPAIKSAIDAQGVTVPSTDSFLDYADRIAEIEGGGSGYQLKDLPTGSISTVNDAAELPLNALKVSVEAWQEGSGDPSPSNVRPIHGWDSGKIRVVGKNWLNFIGNKGSEVTITTTITVGGASATLTNIPSGRYTYSNLSGNTCYVMLSAGDYTHPVPVGSSYTFNHTKGDHLGIQYANISTTTTFKGQMEIGTQATTYEPYQGKQYTLDFPQTICGAEWDVVDGDLKQTDGYIASYNGESLPSTWISDRDVYDGTNTPTIGAEVVYKLATPTTINLSPLSIRMLQGTNNVFVDCGEVIEGEYFIGETKAYDLVEYIESDGTQVIDTGRQVVQGQTIEVTFEGSSNQTAYAWIFGGITSSDYYGYQFPNSSAVYLYNGGTSASSQSGFSSDVLTQKALTFNGSINANIHILGLLDGSTYTNKGKFKVYFLDINGDYFVPAKRRRDGAYGLYDIVNSQFLTDVASGNALTGGASLGIRIG